MGKAIEASRTRFSQTCQIGDDTTFGVIKLILHAEGYDWELISDGHRGAVQNLGSGTCHASEKPLTRLTLTWVRLGSASPGQY